MRTLKLGGLLLATAVTTSMALAQPPGLPPGGGANMMAPPADAPPVKPQPPGPYPVSILADPGLMTHTIYRPEDLKSFTGDTRLPIIAWGNGACSNAGLAFQEFLTQVASHGFMIIVSGPKDTPLPNFAAPPPGTTTGGPPPRPMMSGPRTQDADLITAIGWAIAENTRKDSAYFGKLNPDKVAVMGQSCGGLQATAVAGDPRIKTAVIWNSGTFPPGASPGGPGAPSVSMSGATRDSVAKFHAPVAYFLGGPTDIAYPNGKGDFERIANPKVEAFLGSIHSGHGGTFMHPGGGRFAEVGVAWLQWRLNGDTTAAKYFDGPDCTLCKDPIWEVAKKNMK